MFRFLYRVCAARGDSSHHTVAGRNTTASLKANCQTDCAGRSTGQSSQYRCSGCQQFEASHGTRGASCGRALPMECINLHKRTARMQRHPVRSHLGRCRGQLRNINQVWKFHHFQSPRNLTRFSFRWERDVVYVVLGDSQNSVKIRGPFEQIVRVDCMRSIESSNVILLHMYSQVEFNRHILPIHLPERYWPYSIHFHRPVELIFLLLLSVMPFYQLIWIA